MITIKVKDEASEFAEDKDIAASIREEILRPALRRGEEVRIDFEEVTGATQSFVHAMISDLIRREGVDVLDKIEFSNCNKTVKYIIQIVVEYSQLEVESSEDGLEPE